MSLSVLTIRSTSLVAVDGDSRSAVSSAGDVTTLPRVWVPIKARCNAAFVKPAGQTRPIVPWINWAVDGSKIADALARQAANLANTVPTHIILYITINDARAGTALGNNATGGTVKGDLFSYLTNAFAAGVQQIAVIPCDFSGELWSVGDAGNPNAADATIKSYLAAGAIPATVGAFANALYYDNRAGFFNTQEPIFNSPAPGVAGRILTQDAIGLHHNVKGTSIQAPQWSNAFIRFAA